MFLYPLNFFMYSCSHSVLDGSIRMKLSYVFEKKVDELFNLGNRYNQTNFR